MILKKLKEKAMKGNLKPREIKFRAWDKKGKRFGYFVFHPNSICYPYSEYFEHEVGCERVGFKGVDNSWQQYTGLKDENEKEIYEGDIVRSFSQGFNVGEEKINIVQWDDGAEGGENYRKAQFSPINYIWFNLRSCEVIGNIFENPELLEAIDNPK